ncbi:MAG: hypothetical protein AAFY78_12460 [Cyanobacteria bacterium J06648_16]
MVSSRSSRVAEWSQSSTPSAFGPQPASARLPLCWGAPTLRERGAVVPSPRGPLPSDQTGAAPYNAIGSHRARGGRGVTQAMSVLTGTAASGQKRTDLRCSEVNIQPCPGWFGASAPVSFDPFGATPVSPVAVDRVPVGSDGLEPTIVATCRQLRLPEIHSALMHGWLEADGDILQADGYLQVTQIAIAPVWYLPGIAHRFQVDEVCLRQALFEQTQGLFPELISRPDLSVFLPPLADTTVYIIGALSAIRDGSPLVLHIDQGGVPQGGWLTGSSVCRNGGIQALETSIEAAQAGGVGVLVCLPIQPVDGGHAAPLSAADLTWEQKLVPDVLHWLGITRIEQLLSTGYVLSDWLARSGIEVVQQISLSSPPTMLNEAQAVDLEWAGS